MHHPQWIPAALTALPSRPVARALAATRPTRLRACARSPCPRVRTPRRHAHPARAHAQVGLHSAILYVPKLRQMFKVRALDADDWRLVLCYAAPVLVLEEALKLCHRWIEPPPKPVPVPQAGAAGAGTG